MRRFLFLLLVLVALTSACMGGSSNTKVESKDLVEIKKLDIFPGTTIRPEDSVQIRLEIENIGQIPVTIEVGDITSGEKILFDHCPFVLRREASGNMQIFGAYESNELDSTIPEDHIRLRPGRGVIFQWDLVASSADQLLGLNTECNLGTKVTYNAEAKTTTYVYFASSAEISQNVYTGEDLNQKGDNVASHGPVVVNVETPPQPIAGSDSGRQRSWTAYFNVKNIGSGIVEVKTLNVTLPTEIRPLSLSTAECEFAQGSDADTIVVNETTDRKNLLRVGFQSTSRIVCKLTAPEIAILQPFRLGSHATYDYSIFKNTKVTINTK